MSQTKISSMLLSFFTKPNISNFLRKIVERDFKKQRKIIRKYFSCSTEDKVLDLGCGTGEFSVDFPQANYIGIDIDPENIKYAQKNFEANFEVADGRNLPFNENSFSKVLVVGVFHHLSDSDTFEVLSEIKRVLEPGGKILIMEDTQSNNVLTSVLHHFDQGEFIRMEEEWKRIFSKLNLQESFTFKNGLCYYSCFLASN